MEILEIKNVSYSYANSKEKILSGVNQKFELGKFYAIVGKSGAGNLPVDFIYTPTFNTWQGKTTIQYTINDYQCRRKHE